MAVTAGTLHMGHTHAFYEIMKDPALRSQLFDRLSKRYQSEGLEFFAAVIDRNRLSQDKMAATREILRKYIVNDAPLEVNISSKQKDRIIAAVLQEDTSPMFVRGAPRGANGARAGWRTTFSASRSRRPAGTF
jgi:hypothetical protein